LNNRSLPRAAPSAVGVDADGLIGFLDAVHAAPDIELHSLMMLRHGQVVAEGWWHPYSAERVHLLYSLSKSFTSTAAGFAAAEGLIDLDATVLSYFPELDADITDPRSRAMLVRHVAAMASGHREDTVARAEALDPHDLVHGFLMIPPDEEPGSYFAYNQSCTFTLAAIVQRVSGMSLTEYLRPRLFDPLGVGAIGWIRDASGREIGYSGMYAATEAVAALGQLYLQGGRRGERQRKSRDRLAKQLIAFGDTRAAELGPQRLRQRDQLERDDGDRRNRKQEQRFRTSRHRLRSAGCRSPGDQHDSAKLQHGILPDALRAPPEEQASEQVQRRHRAASVAMHELSPAAAHRS